VAKENSKLAKADRVLRYLSKKPTASVRQIVADLATYGITDAIAGKIKYSERREVPTSKLSHNPRTAKPDMQAAAVHGGGAPASQMAVQVKSLKVFCDVVRRRSFSRAADENHISQSSASQLVQQLEEGLGVKLIDRSRRPCVLTPEGEVYYDGCRGVVESYFAVEDRVRSLHEEVAGQVRVASIYSVGLYHMNRYLQDFLSQYPEANVRLEYLHPHRVYQSVEDDLADLGLVSYPKSSRTVTALAWRKEPMVLVTSPGHALAKRGRISLNELNGEKMVGFDSDLTIRREIDRVLDLHGAAVRVVMEFDNIETIKRAIEIDAGVGLLPEPTVGREVQSGTLAAVPLDTDELVRPLGIIHRRGRELSNTAQRFIELLQRDGHTAGIAGHLKTTEEADMAAVDETSEVAPGRQ
jgi:DNA-binding transcriptional LysR family regulator